MAEKEKKEKTGSKTPKNNTLATMFLSSPQFADKVMYVKEVDCLFLYEKGKYYRIVDPFDLKRALHTFLSNQYPEVGIKVSVIDDIIKQIPMFIPQYYEEYSEDYISLEDCLLNMRTLCAEEHDRAKFSTVYFPFTNEQVMGVETPIFDAFLKHIFVRDDEKTPDEELIGFVQEMFGYLLCPDMDACAAFFLYGDGANGKSTLMDLLIEFFNHRSVSAYSIETLTTRQFATAGLVGKRVNICNEDESKFIKSDKFKSIISGDFVAAERKFGNSFEFRPRVKFIFAANQMPTFDGIDYGLRRRLKIVPFYRTIQDHEKDTKILLKLKAELPGVLRWAMDGLKRLKENNFVFSECESMRNVKMEFAKGISSTLRFFDEYYEKDADSFTPFNEMYEEYKKWCDANGRRPVSSDKFGREISTTHKMKSEQKWYEGRNVRGRTCKRKADAPPQNIMTMQF